MPFAWNPFKARSAAEILPEREARELDVCACKDRPNEYKGRGRDATWWLCFDCDRRVMRIGPSPSKSGPSEHAASPGPEGL